MEKESINKKLHNCHFNVIMALLRRGSRIELRPNIKLG